MSEGTRQTIVANIVGQGQPVSLLLRQGHATVSMCHSRARNLRGVGPMTITLRLQNTLRSYEDRTGV